MSENTLENIIFGLKTELKETKERFIKILDLNERMISSQQAKIERLTAEIDQRQEMMHRMDCNYATELQKNAELKKQVDELKSENTKLYKEHTTLIAGSILKQQDIARDTAKEIIEELNNIKDFFPDSPGGHLRADGWRMCIDKLKEIAKERYGVEVE